MRDARSVRQRYREQLITLLVVEEVPGDECGFYFCSPSLAYMMHESILEVEGHLQQNIKLPIWGKKRKSCCFFLLGFLNYCHFCLAVIWQSITTCHTCQIRGKPNQLCIRLAPLPPNLAIEQPFQYIIVDNVGPWPHLYSGEHHYGRLLIHCNVSDYQMEFCDWDPE